LSVALERRPATPSSQAASEEWTDKVDVGVDPTKVERNGRFAVEHYLEEAMRPYQMIGALPPGRPETPLSRLLPKVRSQKSIYRNEISSLVGRGAEMENHWTFESHEAVHAEQREKGRYADAADAANLNRRF
jgi:hypothetical protein